MLNLDYDGLVTRTQSSSTNAQS